jgi:3-deoxy-D-manno-octulosonic acid kinase
MKDFALIYEGNDIVAYNKLLFESFPLALFDPEYLISNSLRSIRGDNVQGGRGNVYNFEYNNLKLILRHYHRGGVPAKLIRDKYLWLGLEKSRAIQELEMLSAMRQYGLPVPEPAAARINRNGLNYQADIVTVLIPDSKTLSSSLMSAPLLEENWQRIGATIKLFHERNCNHADLNAHNIMLDEHGDIYLIDFDKSKINASSGRWQADNLQRLKRSLEKLAKSNVNFNYQAVDFSTLMQGYAA